ncbi:DoxX family protein [Mucilaginibacter mali]|uniref:DoxX family protein n=1 Tax=Mucilaginibacter mali TaxID=2740462 RepID=A0A7D4QHN8_9SPHI|nr:DoxX family protein [Mucilaginibacter mali]QKJ32112.1 DoxX family protein [Mucilaginibacter mali]
MKPKTIKTTYWILLILLCAFTTFDGIGGVTKQQAGVDVLNHLGYPIYLMPLFGVLKLLGVFALLQPWYQGIKEWVFAGLAFTFIGAAVSHICAHDTVVETIMPLIFLAYLLVTRSFWLKYEALKNAA